MKPVCWIAIGCVLLGAACDGATETIDDGNGDGDSGPDTGTGDGANGGECLNGFDAANPAYRIGGFVPTAPQPLADIAAGAQSSVDDGTTNYLFSMSDVDGDGTVSGTMGLADATDDDDTYSYAGDSTPMTFELDGDTFTSTNDATIDLQIPLFVGDPLLISMHEVTLEGTFKDDEHCTVGSFVEEGPPSVWETAGTLTGKLLVSETKEASISVTSPLPMTFSLCAYFAYGLAKALSLRADPDCEADQSEWSNPPNTTGADGEDAWLVSADIAAVAARLE